MFLSAHTFVSVHLLTSVCTADFVEVSGVPLSLATLLGVFFKNPWDFPVVLTGVMSTGTFPELGRVCVVALSLRCPFGFDSQLKRALLEFTSTVCVWGSSEQSAWKEFGLANRDCNKDDRECKGARLEMQADLDFKG